MSRVANLLFGTTMWSSMIAFVVGGLMFMLTQATKASPWYNLGLALFFGGLGAVLLLSTTRWVFVTIRSLPSGPIAVVETAGIVSILLGVVARMMTFVISVASGRTVVEGDDPALRISLGLLALGVALMGVRTAAFSRRPPSSHRRPDRAEVPAHAVDHCPCRSACSGYLRSERRLSRLASGLSLILPAPRSSLSAGWDVHRASRGPGPWTRWETLDSRGRQLRGSLMCMRTASHCPPRSRQSTSASQLSRIQNSLRELPQQ